MTSQQTAGRCAACSAEIPDGAAVCPRCGTSQRMEPCPLCGAVTGISSNDEMRYVCDVCGGPRVPLDAKGIKRSGKDVAALKRADAARKSRAKNRAGAVVAGVGLAGVLGLVALYAVLGFLGVVSPGFGFVLASLLTAGPLAALTASLVSRSKARGKEIGPALDAAWIAVATDVASQSREAVTPQKLAQALRIEETQAEELVAMLEANDVLHTDGKLRFAAHARIAEPAEPSAEIEAQAEAEAQAALQPEKARERH